MKSIKIKVKILLRELKALAFIVIILTVGSCKHNSKEKFIVLTFDDAVQFHLDFVIPLLKEMGFVATFFICNKWMSDTTNFMNWKDVSEINQLGFEIGNHGWNHNSFLYFIHFSIMFYITKLVYIDSPNSQWLLI